MSYKETIDIISKKNKVILSKEDKDNIYSTKKRILNEIFNFEIYEGILNFLKELKNLNLKLAIVTGANKEFAEKILNNYFSNIFDIIITGNDVKNGKPSPEPYLKATKKLNIKANNLIVIENAPLGIQSAKSAGLNVLAIETTLKKENLKLADKIFKNHKELFDYIRNKFNKK